MKTAKQKKHKTPNNEPSVQCAHSELVATDELNPNPRNPNKHPAKQLDLYAKIILHQGWRRAIVATPGSMPTTKTARSSSASPLSMTVHRAFFANQFSELERLLALQSPISNPQLTPA